MAAVISRLLLQRSHRYMRGPLPANCTGEPAIRPSSVNTVARIHAWKKRGSKRQELMPTWWWIGLASGRGGVMRTGAGRC
jgi:hypothetical protein